MAGHGDGTGEGTLTKLENQIGVIKYVLLFTNAMEWLLGLCICVLCFWLRFDEGINDILTRLNALNLYIGSYILIIGAIIIMVVAFLGCVSALNENEMFILVYIGIQVVAFFISLAGAAVLLDNSAKNSHFQPTVRESMRGLIMNAHYEPARQSLQLIQEGIGCCGADGANDYLNLRQPLPSECRDTVTGNPFYHGCVDELTWFFEEKCGWTAGLVMTVCFFHVVNVVLALVLKQALQKESDTIHT